MFIYFFLPSYCQQYNQPAVSAQSPPDTSVNTEIFWLDLCKPGRLTSLTRTPGRNRLEVNWKNVLSFGLRNTNHFKYDYKINSIPFASFVDTSYGSFANTVRSSVELAPDPFFNFEINSKSPNKSQFILLRNKLDTLDKESAKLYFNMQIIEAKYNFTPGKYPANLPKTFNTNNKDRKLYDSLYQKNLDNGSALNKIVKQLDELLSLTGQKNGLMNITQLLKNINNNKSQSKTISEAFFLSLEEVLKEFPNTINPKDELGRYVYEPTETKIGRLNKMLESYQQLAQIIRNLFGKYEIFYDDIKNSYLGNDCDNFTQLQKDVIDANIKSFLSIKEAFFDLQSLYTMNPLENKYLEDYLLAISKYGEFLFKKFNALQKVLNIDVIYITPSGSNMKNYDLFSLELEKTNKVTRSIEKYNYDIYIKGGLKIDFSAGIFATMLTNEEYTAIDSLSDQFEPTNKKIIRRTDKGKANLAFGGMVNITRRSGAAWVSPGISFGLLVSTQPSVQLVSALSLSLGKTERILLHAGGAFGFVKRIDGLPLDEYIPSARIGENVRTIDKFMVRPFFGLSYNLSKNNVFKISSFTTSGQ